jgi:hypothetical protein
MTASEVVIADALAQVELGFEVFALGRNVKTPVTEHGWKNATGNPDWARTQLEQKAAGNYGMVWPVDSLPLVVAFDLDDGKEGPGDGPDWTQRMATLQKRLGKLPMTKQTATPSGGRHMFLYWPADVPLPPGDEALGWTMRYPGRHYVVGPSSTIDGSTYESNGLGIAALPRAWVDAIVAEHAPKKALIVVHGDGYVLPDSIGPGHRYSTVRDYSASKWAQGLKLEEIWQLVKAEVAPRFTVGKPALELRSDFERAMHKIEERLGPQPRKGGMSVEDAVAAVAPIVVRPLSDYAVEAVTWLWHRWLPVGSVTLFDGNPGEGKSTVVADLIARLTTGGAWPDGTPVGPPATVLYITKEDDPNTQVRPRIEAAGGDVSKVLFVGTDLLFPRDVPRFREMLHETRPRLVLLDPLMSYLEGKVRAISDNEVRSALMTPLGDLARTYSCALLVIRHFNKGTGQSALNRGAGSLGGLSGAARLVMSLTAHPGEEDHRVFGVIKSNYEARPRALKAAIEAAPVEGFQMTVSRAAWLGESDVTIVDAMEQTSTQHEELRQAMDDLADILDPRKAIEPVPSSKVKDQMKARGHSRNMVERARKGLGVVVEYTKTVPTTTTWMLPTVSLRVAG